MMRKFAALIVVITGVVSVQSLFTLPLAKLTLRAVDEQGVPIEGARVDMSFEKAISNGVPVPVSGLTDAKGEFSGEGHSEGYQGGQASKEGYYPGSTRSYKFQRRVLGKWQPWNPTIDVVLKKVVHPIPMYARKVGFDSPRTSIPGVDREYGFDLIESDWVAPHGKGKVSDFRFTLERRFVSWEDYDVKVTVAFSNPGDGLQAIDTSAEEKKSSISDLRLPREAPLEPYDSELVTRSGRAPGTSGYEDRHDSRSYFFRVRTIRNAQGKIVSGLYGKIDQDIDLDAINSQTCNLQFTYYLNPTPNDRNLEFDPKRNLIPDLSWSERVTMP